MFLGAFETSLERLREAEALAHAAGDRRRLGLVLVNITYNLASLGDLAGALEAGERAAATLSGQGEPHRADVVRARVRYGLGEYRQGIEICRGSEPWIEAQGRVRGSALVDRFTGVHGVYIRIWRVLCLAELGQFTEAAVWGDQAIREAEMTTTLGPPERIWAYVGVGRLHVVRGAFEQAIAVLEPAMRMFEGGALTVYFPRIAASLGTAYVHTGRVADGLVLLRQAEARGASIQFRYGQPLVLTQLAEAWLRVGDRIRSIECATQALALARQSRACGSEAYAAHLLGELAALADPPDATAAEMHYREALSLAEERSMHPLVAHCHLGLGRLYRRTGDHVKAHEHLTTASAMYREMDMGFWLAQAETAVPEESSDEASRLDSRYSSSRLSPRRSPPRRSRCTGSGSCPRAPLWLHSWTAATCAYSAFWAASGTSAIQRATTSFLSHARRREDPSDCGLWRPSSCVSGSTRS